MGQVGSRVDVRMIFWCMVLAGSVLGTQGTGGGGRGQGKEPCPSKVGSCTSSRGTGPSTAALGITSELRPLTRNLVSW